MPNGKKVLAIEDEKFLSNVLKQRLEKEGFTVSQAFDGEDGLKKAREEKPDLILLDLILPQLSGFEFLQTVKTDPQLSQIPVVVASNLGQQSDIEKAKSFGVIDYYVKATTPVDDIVGMVKRSLGVPESEVMPEAAPAESVAQPEAMPQGTPAEMPAVPNEQPQIDPNQPPIGEQPPQQL